MQTEALRDVLRAAAEEAIAAVHPSRCVPAAVSLDGSRLFAGHGITDLDSVSRLVVVGAGKASATMAAALEEIFGSRIDDGLVITADGYGVPTERIDVVEASHPLPDERGVEAAAKVLRTVQLATDDDLVIALISGGASSLLTSPHPEIALEDLHRTNDLMLHAGLPIEEINTVRKHLSRIKGGRLAARAHPARVISLILSDVPGDTLTTVASGPTTADPTTYADALDILERYCLSDRVPRAIRRLLQGGAHGVLEETPKPGDPRLSMAENILIGSGRDAVGAALRFGETCGLRARRLPWPLTGEARAAGRAMGELARELRQHATLSEPSTLLAGSGETTVTVTGSGHGGRNQELALAAAASLEGLDSAVVCALGTDGRDGPTDAAGALVDGGTADRVRAAGIDLHAALEANDAYPALAAAGDLLITGPTGTNVADLVLVATSR
ncbi:MAG: glycerate kinase [Candidatus Bipolaricaulota bacterium]|nr:MAG: glycerate kinase [Candidatus Bipolaricaulota bacterium]